MAGIRQASTGDTYNISRLSYWEELRRALSSINGALMHTHPHDFIQIGTEFFSAPEVLRDPASATPASDIFSIGAIASRSNFNPSADGGTDGASCYPRTPSPPLLCVRQLGHATAVGRVLSRGDGSAVRYCLGDIPIARRNRVRLLLRRQRTRRRSHDGARASAWKGSRHRRGPPSLRRVSATRARDARRSAGNPPMPYGRHEMSGERVGDRRCDPDAGLGAAGGVAAVPRRARLRLRRHLCGDRIVGSTPRPTTPAAVRFTASIRLSPSPPRAGGPAHRYSAFAPDFRPAVERRRRFAGV